MRLKFILVLLGIIMLLVISSYLFLKGSYVDWKPNQLGSLRKEFCEVLGGEMRTTGCGIAGCAYSCKFAYKDGGKTCQSSKDCSGKCIVTKPNIQPLVSTWPTPVELKNCREENNKLYDCSGQNFQAQCEKWPQGNCEPVWEYDKGVIKSVFGNCTM